MGTLSNFHNFFYDFITLKYRTSYIWITGVFGHFESAVNSNMDLFRNGNMGCGFVVLDVILDGFGLWEVCFDIFWKLEDSREMLGRQQVRETLSLKGKKTLENL